MKRNNLLIILFFLFFCLEARAEIIYLKDGSVIKGKITSDKSYSVTVEEAGYPRKIYKDQIEHIEQDVKANGSEGSSAEKTQLILDLLEANGTRPNLVKNFEAAIARAPLEKQEALKEVLNADEIIKKIVPVYDKNFSEEELKEMIQFYQSPAGKKLVEKMPAVLQEVMQVSTRYLQEKLSHIQEK